MTKLVPASSGVLKVAEMKGDGETVRVKSALLDWTNEQERLAMIENTFPDTIQTISRETEERLRALGYLQ